MSGDTSFRWRHTHLVVSCPPGLGSYVVKGSWGMSVTCREGKEEPGMLINQSALREGCRSLGGALISDPQCHLCTTLSQEHHATWRHVSSPRHPAERCLTMAETRWKKYWVQRLG